MCVLWHTIGDNLNGDANANISSTTFYSFGIMCVLWRTIGDNLNGA